MGKAIKWIRAFLGMKKSEDSALKKESRNRSFTKSGKESAGIGIPANEEENSPWLTDHFADKEQTKHAIAVAAAAADAAFAAAQAAVAVVRITSQSKGASVFAAGRELRAAVKIQAVFRSFLARKALRALKGLVKLQALVRGFLVRKRAAAALHSMKSLFRAQAIVWAQRNRGRKCIDKHHDNRLDFCTNRIAAQLYNNPKIMEIDLGHPRSMSSRTNPSPISEYYHNSDVSSPLQCPIPARLSIPEYRIDNDFDRGLVREDRKCLSSHNTPRFDYAAALSSHAKSINPPSYMANTSSFNAKLRSQSAPRQQRESGLKNRLPLMASRSSFNGD